MELSNSKQDISLKKILKSDLELIRNWRNSDYVKQFMVFQDFISPQMQEEWYLKVDNDYNFYFIILNQNIPIGLANIKDINSELSSGEWGIFLSSSKFLNSGLGIKSTFLLLDYAFEELQLSWLYSTTLTTNLSARNFGKKMGVKVLENDNIVIKGILYKTDYLNKSKNLKESLTKYI
jgi:UDP-4-amino-4,6-dideoxy-N-acetyl-beta-L-altrosamine N-acetyltransferase